MPRGAILILKNEKEELFLQLRDDKEGLPYRNQWTLPGGALEEGEEPLAGALRELQEEFELRGISLQLWRTYAFPESTEYVFIGKLDADLGELPVHEGQCVQYFTLDDALRLPLAYHDNEILKDYMRN